MNALNQAAFDAAYHAFVAHPGDSRPSVEAAIETYMAETFKLGAGELIVGEAIQPQRDYRKELWLAHWASVPASTTFDTAVASVRRAVGAFDAFFGEAK